MADTRVYVIGDAGKDEFKVDKKSSFEIKAGSPFIAEVLKTLLDSVSIECLTKECENSQDPEGYSALCQKIAELKRYEKVWRICRYGHEGDGSKSKIMFRLEKPLQFGARILIAHNAGGAWDQGATNAHLELVESFLQNLGKRKLAFPSILINLSDALPALKTSALNHKDIIFESELWERLCKNWRNVAIVTSLTALRQAGVFVTRRLSWEQGIEDLSAELHRFPRLRVLTQFRHLFIRLGMVGYMHIERNEKGAVACPLIGKVYFSPYADRGIHRDHEAEGATIGRNILFIAALVKQILKSKEDLELQNEVFARSLKMMRCVDDMGYSDEVVNSTDGDGRGDRLIKAFAECAKKVLDSGSYVLPEVGSPDTLGVSDIPTYVLAAPPPNALQSSKRWHILDDALMDAPAHRINVAMAIVMGGHERVINRRWDKNKQNEFKGVDHCIWDILSRVEYYNPKDHAPDYVTLRLGNRPAIPEWPPLGPNTPPIIGDLDKPFQIYVPVANLGDLILMEREEIETMRGIYNLLVLYRSQIKRTTNAKPISIAVFGPPGSGKSFAVKQIAQNLGGKGVVPVLEFNVSQFRRLEDLASAFDDVIKVRNERGDVTPLVFFDEFDCVWENRELGWLKYFLAPMQDGMFQNRAAAIGPAIFVFAGGVYASFDRFDPTTDATYDNLRELDEYKRRLKAFVEQKGPDFISRLRGHINILEINDVQGRAKHFIRRAIQLRALLKQNERINNDGQARIDDAIVYALLTVDRYRHGVRSMQAIVGMCTPIYDRIDIASLPSRAQLNMHVDAEEFLIRIQRGRLRSQLEWNPRRN